MPVTTRAEGYKGTWFHRVSSVSLVSNKVVLNVMPTDMTQQNNFVLISDKLYVYPCSTWPNICAVNFFVQPS